LWSYWFENGQLAARGRYEHDRKVGDWTYWDKQGDPMPYEAWEREYEEYDWAYDDYTGTPKGENWPEPPQDGS
jgi:antitoxin component YwqK of YwqJK toxin-antitoxin module